MAVVCTIENAEVDNVDIDNPGAAGDYVLFAVGMYTAVNPIGALATDAGWLTQLKSEATAFFEGELAFYGGIVPDGGDAAVNFSNTANEPGRWTVIAKAWSGVSPTVPIAASDEDELGDPGAVSWDISMGPVAAPEDGCRLVYMVAAIHPDQTNFENGPTPAIANNQLGRTIALNPAMEVGIWSEEIDTGDSAVYTQTIAQASGAFVEVGAAMLLVLQPDCPDVS